jgi:hypothetical protein
VVVATRSDDHAGDDLYETVMSSIGMVTSVVTTSYLEMM